MRLEELKSIYDTEKAFIRNIRRAIINIPNTKKHKPPVTIITKTTNYTFATINFSRLSNWDISHHTQTRWYRFIADELKDKTTKEIIYTLDEIVTKGGVTICRGDEWYERFIQLPDAVVNSIKELLCG